MAGVVPTLSGTVLAPVQAVAFWVAVVLPIVYGPGLALYGHGAIAPDALVGILGIHAVALLAGHGHVRSERERA